MSAHPVSPELVGRSAEIGHLAGAFDNAPATVLVGGEAGVGKSRLVAEFTTGLDATVLLGGCVELDGLPFAPFVAALRGVPVTDRERVDLAPLLPASGEPADTGDEARPRLFEGVLSLLDRLSAPRPVVLLVEDAHWLDRSSRDLLDFLVRNQRAVPRSLFVVTYRSDELGGPARPLLAELSRVPWVRRFELPRLSARDVRAQLRGILGVEPDPVRAREVFRRSEGNPLFVEALVDGGAVLSLEELLLSRVERLAPEAVAVVRAAAVGGRRVSHDLLGKVCDPSPLRSIVDAGVLVVEGDGYAFRHALIRDVVYRRLLPGERVELHARYAAVLPPSAAAESAHHRYAAGDVAGAVSAAWEAAGAARRALAYAEQLAMLERVLSLWEHASHLDVDRTVVLEAAAEAASRAGEHERGEELATDLLAALDPEVEPIRFAAVLELRGRLRAQPGRPGALADHREAVRLAPVGHPVRGYLLNSLATRLMEIPRPDEAREVAEEALSAAHHAGDAPSEAAALITLAVLDARLGDLDAQLPRLRRARAIAEHVAAHRVRLRALHCESSLSEAYGRLAEAEELARLGLRTARGIGLARSAGAVHAVDLARALFAAGRWDEALECVDHALDHAPPATFHAHLLCLAGLVDVHRGAVDRAEWAVTRARELADGPFNQDPYLLPRLEAEVRLAQGRVDEAVAVVRAVVDVPRARVASRFVWPLVELGTRVGLPVPEMPVAGPVQHAWQVTSRGEWREAVAEWEALRQPLWHARALLGLARETREPDALRRAAALADGLGAVPLRAEIADLARRARVVLTGEGEAERARFGLTAREVEILRLVTDGLANREIGERLFISAKTASVHVSNILGKLGVANRVEAAATAHRLRLFD